MSKKKLLEESTIRSFMKLANLAPLTNTFLKESEALEEEAVDEAAEEEGKMEEAAESEEETVTEEAVEEGEQVDESAHVMMGRGDKDREQGRDVPKDRQAESGGGGSGHKKAPAPQKAKAPKLAKMDAAKNAPGDAKLKPLKQGTAHTGTSAETKQTKPNSPKKNNAQFDLVSENLEEVELEEEMEDEAADMAGDMGAAPEGETPSDAAGESPEHQDKVKGVIQSILSQLQTLAGEYGIDMEVDSGEGGEEGDMEAGEEMPAPGGEMEAPPAGEEEGEEEAKLEEMLNKLTKRVAERLVKESAKAKAKAKR